MTFNLLNSNEMGNQDLSCTIQLPSLVMAHLAVVSVLECTHTYINTQKYSHTHNYSAVKRHMHASEYVCIIIPAQNKPINYNISYKTSISQDDMLHPSRSEHWTG